MSGTTEVWGGPLSGGDYVMAAVNRGSVIATIRIEWEMLEVQGVTASAAFDVRDVWNRTTIYKAQTKGFSTQVSSHDISIFRLTKA